MSRCFIKSLQKWATLALSLMSLLFTCVINAQSDGQALLWVTPTFATTAPIKKEITVESIFNYHLYTPLKGHDDVRLVRRKYSSMASAEDALVARMSAVSSVDYQWWLDTWQEDSKQIALPFFKQKGFDQSYWESTWKKQFVGRKIKLKHKVIYQDYAILIYNVSEPNGKESFFDLPIVFERDNEQWMVSLDIRKSPLLRYSPWVEGIESKKVVYE